jgi:hypothetical protein
MTHVFVLQHVHILPSGEEDIKMIGVYRSETLALAAIERLKHQPGFCRRSELIDYKTDPPTKNGFCISKYLLDQDHWTEGYVTLLPNGEERDE